VGHGLSLEAQQAKLTAYAAVYELALVAIEVDVGVSAKTLQRPALQQALGALKAGKAEVLLVVKLDRLTRSVRDLGALVETYCLAGIWRKACPILPDPESPNRSPSPEVPLATPNAPVPDAVPLKREPRVNHVGSGAMYVGRGPWRESMIVGPPEDMLASWTLVHCKPQQIGDGSLAGCGLNGETRPWTGSGVSGTTRLSASCLDG